MVSAGAAEVLGSPFRSESDNGILFYRLVKDLGLGGLGFRVGCTVHRVSRLRELMFQVFGLQIATIIVVVISIAMLIPVNSNNRSKNAITTITDIINDNTSNTNSNSNKVVIVSVLALLLLLLLLFQRLWRL